MHWLGSSNLKKASKFVPFTEALDFARSLNLASEKEWRVWHKEGVRPLNMPSDPPKIYKDRGWQGWGHWLGTGDTRRQQHHAALALRRGPGRGTVPQPG